MPRLLSFLLLALAFLVQGCQSGQPLKDAAEEASDEKPAVLLTSLDGFRWDYAARHETPNLDRIAARGVRAERLVPVFPTKTFPNHYTQVTGLYPENHGIVSNTMYDPKMDASFSLGNREAIEDPRWWDGEPLWVTAEKQGQTAATYFWPGSEAPIQDVRPTHWKAYDSNVPGEERVEEVLRWLDLPPEERPTFLTLYFSRVDGAGHEHGPNSEAVAGAIQAVDTYLGQLLDGLEARGLLDRIHLIVVSDHGMIETSSERIIFLDDHLDLDDVEIVDSSPVLMLRPAPGKEDEVFERLQEASRLTVYRKEDMPEALHFSDHHRIPPILGLADEGWSITTRDRYDKNPSRFDGGAHGYDHRLKSMHGIFYAQGPAFAAGNVVAPFSSVHLYELMAHLLDLDPAPNDGHLDSTHTLLAPERASSQP